jgi:hypothetical protein
MHSVLLLNGVQPYRYPDVSKLIVEVSAHDTLLHFTLALTPLHSIGSNSVSACSLSSQSDIGTSSAVQH